MAKYKTLPNYELTRPNVYVVFDGDGNYETDNVNTIAILDGCSPFIERVDAPEPVAKPKAKTETKPVPKKK